MTHKKVNGKYSCEICSKTYTHSKKLKDHYNKKHTDDELKGQDIDKEALKHKSKRRLNSASRADQILNHSSSIKEQRPIGDSNHIIQYLKSLRYEVSFIMNIMDDLKKPSTIVDVISNDF